MNRIFTEDVAAIFTALQNDWPKLAGKRIFLTGGTGFIGRWMLEALAEADRRLQLGVAVDILTRDPQAFAAKAPGVVEHPGFRCVTGDVLALRTADGGY